MNAQAPVLSDIADGVMTITLNRPEAANAVRPDDRDALIALLATADADEKVRVVVLRANGKHFCSGADVGSLAERRAHGEKRVLEPTRRIMNGAQKLVASVLDCNKPVIAAVHGAATGLGAHVVYASDLVIATENAYFAESFVKRGLVVDGGGCYLLPRRIGMQKAKEMAFFGEKALSRRSIHAGTGEPGGQRRRLRHHGRRLRRAPGGGADHCDRVHETVAQRLPRHRPLRCIRRGGHGAGDPVVFARLHRGRPSVRGEASHRVHRVVRVARADIPTIDSASAPYWEAARQGQLLIAECAACGRVHHYPRPFCPFCWSEDVHPVQASGTGTLYTYSTVYVNDLVPFKERLPYVAAIVELAEGPRLMTTIEGASPDDLRVGMPVTAVFRPIDDADPDSPYLTVFTPSEESP